MPNIGGAVVGKAARAARGGIAFFTDPAEYQSHFRDLRIEFAIRGGGDFEASFSWLELPNLFLFGAAEKLPRIAYLMLPCSRAYITFPTRFDPLPIWNGAKLSAGDVVFHSLGERFHQLTSGPTEWGTIAIKPDYLSRQSAVLLGYPLEIPRAGQIVRPPKAIARELRSVHAQACQLAQGKMARIMHPQIAKALEEEIMQLMLACISVDQKCGFAARPPDHGLIVSNLSETLMMHGHDRLSAKELSALVGTSERTLRTSCAEILGMSPTRYERLWRLNKVWQHLRHPGPSHEAITAVAKRYGFSDPGRFAVQYRMLFGESPSVTRKRAIGRISSFAEFA